MEKQALFKIRGMQRDLCESAFNPEYAYEIKNMRVYPTQFNTLFSLINEKGTADTNISFKGTPLGCITLNDCLIVFTTDGDDYIYKITTDTGDNIHIRTLYGDGGYGSLGFDTKYPIEALGYYENEKIQKVYWTDGYNHPRSINIAKDYYNLGETLNSVDTQFDFQSYLKFRETVDIKKNLSTIGTFKAGTLQYCLTYSKKYGKESNIFYTSPLYYSSVSNPNQIEERGGTAEETSTINNSFSIKISNADTNYDYVNIYSIFRSSLNAAPTCRKVTSLPIDTESGTSTAVLLEYTDIGSEGSSLLPTELLSIGCKNISIGTMAQKDNVLFYGNITTKSITFDKSKKATLKNNVKITWNVDSVKTVKSSNTEHNVYDYKIQLDNNSQEIKTFKNGEQYRLGIQFLDCWGNWSEVVYLGDYTCDKNPSSSFIANTDIKLPYAHAIIDLTSDDTATIKQLYDNGYRKFRPVIAFLPPEKRKFICEGVLNPTVFNIGERLSGGAFSRASWFFRPNAAFELVDYPEKAVKESSYNIGVGGKFTSPFSEQDSTLYRFLDGNGEDYGYYSYLYEDNWTKEYAGYFPVEDFLAHGNYCEFRHMSALPANRFRNSEIQGMFNAKSHITYLKDSSFGDYSTDLYTENTDYNIPGIGSTPPDGTHFNNDLKNQPLLNYVTDINTFSSNKLNYKADFQKVFCVDQSIVTFNSPDIQVSSTNPIYNIGAALSGNSDSYELKITGIIPITSSTGDQIINRDTDFNTISHAIGSDSATYYPNPLVKQPYTSTSNSNYTRFGFKRRLSYPGWADYIHYTTSPYHLGSNNHSPYTINNGGANYVIYPFHCKIASNAPQGASIIKSKYLFNEYFSFNTLYLGNPLIYDVEDFKTYSDTSKAALSFKTSDGYLHTYKGYGDYSSINDSNHPYLIYVSESGYSAYESGGGYINEYYYMPLMRGAHNRTHYDTGNYDNTSISTDSKGFIVEFKGDGDDGVRNVSSCYRHDGVNIYYNSSPHLMISLKDYNNNNKYYQHILPTLSLKYSDNKSHIINDRNLDFKNNGVLFFDNFNTSATTDPYFHYNGYKQDTVDLRTDLYGEETSNPDYTVYTGITDFKDSLQFGYLWLATIYNKNGGFTSSTENALKNETWLPCGDSKQFTRDEVKFEFDYLEGDVYYQRFDCLKTYPFADTEGVQVNNIIDTLSFMCCGHQNIDGRYDFNATNTPINNRYNIYNTGSRNYITLANPLFYSLLNTSYSQTNNYFTQSYTDTTDVDVKSFNNTIGWTKTKVAGAEIDTWDKLDMVNTTDLDGDKGTIQAIRKYNNNLYAFQNSGVSSILFNNRTQISTADGNPIQLATSGTVDGKQYLTETLGCSNKWSICQAESGLWFIDDITKGIYCFTDKFENMSDKLGFHSWINQNSINTGSWTINNWTTGTVTDLSKSFVTQYDKINGDIFFINEKDCLCFSENLGQFSSFYSYEKTPYMINLKDRFFHIHYTSGYKLWEAQKGDYNSFYGTLKPYWVEIIANPDYYKEKIFDTLAFNATTYSKYTGYNNKLNTSSESNTIALNDHYQEISSFKRLTCWNDYQTGELLLNYNLNQRDSIRKKFDMFRTLIPRDNINGNYRDRLCSPYLHLKLSSDTKNLDKNTTVLQNMLVTYSE